MVKAKRKDTATTIMAGKPVFLRKTLGCDIPFSPLLLQELKYEQLLYEINLQNQRNVSHFWALKIKNNSKGLNKTNSRACLGGKVSVVKKTFIVFLLLMMIFIVPTFSQAVSLGVSPGAVSFLDVLPNGYSEQSVTVSTNSPDEVLVRYRVNGNISSWIRFEPNASLFPITATEPYTLTMIVEPPSDIATGNYSGSISFITERFGNISGRAGGLVRAAVTLISNMEIVTNEIPLCHGGALKVNDLEIGDPLEIEATIVNDGNVRVRPDIQLNIWDFSETELIMSDSITIPSEIRPTVEEKVIVRPSSEDLRIGQYWAEVRVDECDARNYVTFSVVRQGGIVDIGTLTEVNSKTWAFVNETLRINALFRNEGPRVVTASFVGDIKLNNEIIQIIETNPIDVPSGDKVEMFTYFTPKKPGRYVASGRVNYNDKVTFEKGTVINVNLQGVVDKKKTPWLIPLLLYLLVVITIIFLLRKLIKERKKRRRKIW